MTVLSRAIAAATDGARVCPRWLVLTLAGIGFLLLWGLPTIIIPLATDQVLYALGARTILDGGQLYRDFWEQKPPLVFLLYAVPFALAGEHMEAIRVLDLVNTALAMGALYLLGRRFFNERAALLGAALYGFTYLTWTQVDALGEAESFMAAPLVLAFFLYLPEDGGRRTGLRALGAGLMLGVVFALKTTAILFALGLPAAELLLRVEGRWTARGAAVRLGLAATGFLLVQAAVAGYLAVGGVLGDFIDIQRRYTAPYSAYRFPPEGSHLRFVLSATSDWIQSTPYLVVPAAVGVFFALFRWREAGAVGLLAVLALLGVAGIWWQGKLFNYHWLIVVPLLAPLAGFAVDQLGELFARLTRSQALAGWALLGVALLVLAYEPLAGTYDNYRTLVRYADGTMTRRDVEAYYFPLYTRNHELVDYVRSNSGPEDQLFIWGFWPVSYFWLDRPLVSRFAENPGLRATWAPQSWRDELMEDLLADPPRYIAVARGDNQPWLVGNAQTSDEHLRYSFPELRRFIEEQYVPVRDLGLFLLYERTAPSAAGG